MCWLSRQQVHRLPNPTTPPMISTALGVRPWSSVSSTLALTCLCDRLEESNDNKKGRKCRRAAGRQGDRLWALMSPQPDKDPVWHDQSLRLPLVAAACGRGRTQRSRRADRQPPYRNWPRRRLPLGAQPNGAASKAEAINRRATPSDASYSERDSTPTEGLFLARRLYGIRQASGAPCEYGSSERGTGRSRSPSGNDRSPGSGRTPPSPPSG